MNLHIGLDMTPPQQRAHAPATIGILACVALLAGLFAPPARGASRAGLRRHRGSARPQRRRPRDRQAPRSGEAPWLYRRAPGHEGARYGRRRRLQHRIDGARGGPERQGLWAERARPRRPGEGADRGARANPGDEERRHAGAAVRRSAACRCARFGPRHLLLLLPRHDLHAGRSRRDEPQALRRAQAGRRSGDRRPLRASRATARRSRRRSIASRRACCAARSRRPASSWSARATSSATPRTPAISRSTGRPDRWTSSCSNIRSRTDGRSCFC